MKVEGTAGSLAAGQAGEEPRARGRGRSPPTPGLSLPVVSPPVLLTQIPDTHLPLSVPVEVAGEESLQLQAAIHLHFPVQITHGENWALFICSPGAATPLENAKIQFYIKKGFFYFFFLF